MPVKTFFSGRASCPVCLSVSLYAAGGDMKNAKSIAAIVIGTAILLAGAVLASQEVRVVSTLEGVEASFACRPLSNGASLALGLSAVAVTDIDLDGRMLKKVELPDAPGLLAGELGEDGRPDLPILSSCIALPDMAGITLSVTYSGYDIIEDVDLAPVQPSEVEGEDIVPPFTKDEAFYSRDIFYPENLAEAGDPAIMRDIRFAQVTLYPVQYNPARRELRIYRDLQVSVSYDYVNVQNPKMTRRPYLSEGFVPIYRSLFSNFDQLFSTTEVKRGGILIIAKPTFVDSLAQ
jgi:hypothetical protein